MRNYSIDILKSVCAFAVVLIHLPTPQTQYYLPLIVFAVPVFFMISGFLLYDESNDIMKVRIIRRIVRIFFIFIFSSIVYILYYKVDVNLITIIQILVYNLPDYAEHLWYLPAYIYVLFVLHISLISSREKILYRLIPLLLIIGFCMSSYSVILFGRQFPPFLSRNFLFIGLPYFFLGLLIKKNQERVSIFKKKYFVLTFFFSLGTSYIEHFLLTSNNLLGSRIYSFSVCVIAVSLFLLTINTRTYSPSWLSRIGEKHSLNLYIFHPLVYNLINPYVANCWICIILVILLIIIGDIILSFLRKVLIKRLVLNTTTYKGK